MLLQKKENRGNVYKFFSRSSMIMNILFMFIMFFCACFFDWVAIIAFAYLFACSLCDNVRNGISYVLFSIPFLNLCLPFTDVFFILSAVGVFIKLIVLKIRDGALNIKLSAKTIILITLFFAFCFIPTNGMFGVGMIVKAFCFFTIFAIIFLLIKFPEDIRARFNLRVLIVALLCASLMALLRPYSMHLQSIIEVHMVDRFVRFGALFGNTNNLSFFCIICISVLTYFLVSGKSNKWDILTFIVLVSLGFSTLSKSFMVIMAVDFLILFVFAIKNKSRALWVCLLIILLELAIISFIMPDLIYTYLSRFNFGLLDGNFEDAMNTLTTSRYELWVSYLVFIVNNPLVLFFGRSLIAPIIGPFYPHNIYISSIYQLGLVGTILFVLAIVFFVKDIKNQVNYKLDSRISTTLVILALIAFAEDIIFTII